MPLFHGVVVLTNQETGRSTALLDGGELTAGRTGAVANLATRLCAPDGAAVRAGADRFRRAPDPLGPGVLPQPGPHGEVRGAGPRAPGPSHGVRHGEGHRRRRRGHLHGDLD